MSQEAYNPKLVHLPGSRLTPEVVLHRTLNKVDRIKAVAVIILWDDDSYDTDWSNMKLSELVMSGKVLDLDIAQELELSKKTHDYP